MGMFVFSLLTISCQVYASTVIKVLELTSSNRDQTFDEVVKGQIISVTLCNPGDGGYKFDTPQYDSSILNLISHVNIPIQSNIYPPMPGGCYGNDVFKFQVLNTGTSKLNITASQPWIGGSTSNMFNATFVISPYNSSGPVISGVSGPQQLTAGQQGTWTVNATSRYGGNLNYSVIWGDEVYYPVSTMMASSLKYQTATFTHAYNTAGNYSPKFRVEGDNGVRCITTPCNSTGVAETSISVSVSNSRNICPLYAMPAPGWCYGGVVTGPFLDNNGCYGQPVCSLQNVDNGCFGGNRYSITTGQLCPATIIDGGCSNGSKYSSTTGQLCYNSSYNNYRILRLTIPRMTGDDVRTLQRFLELNADGVYGRGTAYAVSGWQAENGLVSDGAVGPLTRARMGY